MNIDFIDHSIRVALSVGNNGKAPSTGVKVEFTGLDSDVFSLPIVSKGYVDYDTQIWYIGSMGLNEEATIVMYAKGWVGIDISGTVSGDNIDPDLDNNTFSFRRDPPPVD